LANAINPPGRKKLAAEMIEGNFDTVTRDALRPGRWPGPLVLDVNAGVTAVNPNETEPPLLVRDHQRSSGPGQRADLHRLLRSRRAESGAGSGGRPALVNSCHRGGGPARTILPLIKQYNVPVIAILQ
jgi:5-methyltetrahydrofolate--homocysteine methyltransferase